ncbi:MAG TPA: hypothetical protein VFK88_11665 [Gallionella sp.]|nr:hypothetical protein [Gallionella sp.]
MTTPVLPDLPEDEKGRVTERPDGFYWVDKETEEEFGPFETLFDAMQDMQKNGNGSEEGESLEEAEAEIGIADWIDQESGHLAEESPPHLHDE